MATKIQTYWNEQWASITTKHPTNKCDYQISNHGRIKSIEKETGDEKLLKGSIINKKFLALNIKLVDRIRHQEYIHKFVAIHFLGDQQTEERKFVVHVDGNRKNNHVKNLKWVSQKEMNQHFMDLGIYGQGKGERRGAKLDEEQVARLKGWLIKGKTKKRILAKRLGITQTQINRIEKGENWADVKPKF